MSRFIEVTKDDNDNYVVDPNSSGASIETNKGVTINVSTYTEPVAVLPSEGEDGMARVTVTLSNIPSGGTTKLYAMFNDELYGGDYLWVASLTEAGIAIKYTSNGSKLVKAGTTAYHDGNLYFTDLDGDYTDVLLYNSDSDDVDLYD